MGDVVYLRARDGKRGSKRKTKRKEPIGLNVYIDAEDEELARRIKRNVLHGILCAFEWELTRGLFKELFRSGSVFRIRCHDIVAQRIRAEIALRLPDLTVRRVIRSA